MEVEDVRLGTDSFLERSGPPTMDIPYHRDGFYMLEGLIYSPSFFSLIEVSLVWMW